MITIKKREKKKEDFKNFPISKAYGFATNNNNIVLFTEDAYHTYASVYQNNYVGEYVEFIDDLKNLSEVLNRFFSNETIEKVFISEQDFEIIVKF